MEIFDELVKMNLRGKSELTKCKFWKIANSKDENRELHRVGRSQLGLRTKERTKAPGRVVGPTIEHIAGLSN